MTRSELNDLLDQATQERWSGERWDTMLDRLIAMMGATQAGATQTGQSAG